MNVLDTVRIKTPELFDRGTLTIAGLSETFPCMTEDGIPSLWQRFSLHIDRIPGQVGKTVFGVVSGGHDDDPGFDYMAGVLTEGNVNLPDGFTTLRIPAQRYAVFCHRDHISSIRETIHSIWNEWLPISGLTPGQTPSFLEVYGEQFDPITGEGGIEIWVPIRA